MGGAQPLNEQNFSSLSSITKIMVSTGIYDNLSTGNSFYEVVVWRLTNCVETIKFFIPQSYLIPAAPCRRSDNSLYSFKEGSHQH